jgi:hypothetical protein
LLIGHSLSVKRQNLVRSEPQPPVRFRSIGL